MSDNNYVAIGDVHGCLNSLQALAEKLEKYSDRQFVFLGDYIDRGPDSKGVVDFLLEYREKQDCIFLRGNHEQMLLDAYHNDDLDLWLMNGGRSKLVSYGSKYNQLDIPEIHIAFYRDTKMY
ncbi:MAG TPA: metallophosphoesterase family protein, partial [Halalkalibaculum sp.]|nr:metallophosphoesterase family protein [Halalkalibaculum sp.]